MSMLDEQIKELYEMADAIHRRSREIGLDYGMGRGLADASRMLREAANTIERFRDRLQTVSGTCEDVSTKNGIFKCSECGCTVEEDGVDWGEIHYCPDCGKWVKR